MMQQKTAAELLSTVVYSHHGISDCIDFESGCTLQERRAEKECQEDIVKERFFRSLIKRKSKKCAKQQMHNMFRLIKNRNVCAKKHKTKSSLWKWIFLYWNVFQSIAFYAA